MFNLSGEQARGGTLCHSKAGLKIGSTATNIATAAPNGAGVDFESDGKMFHYADNANVAVTAGQVIAAGETAILLVCLSAADSPALSTVLGTAVDNDDVTAETAEIHYPAPTDGTCPIGAIKVKNGTASDFTTGTTAFNATSVTTTYIDLGTIPSAPETS